MPRLMATDENQVVGIAGPGNFQYSRVKIENLGASEYTLVTIVCDISGSVVGFAGQLLDSIKMIVKACKKSPRVENLLVRFLTFDDKIYEIHGFKELSKIDENNYEPLKPYGYTALFDATYDAIGATLTFSKELVDLNYDCNGAIYIITDGMNNRGIMTPKSIKDKIESALKNEEIESLVSILIGLHDPNDSWSNEVKKHLNDFKEDAGLTQFIDVGDATAQKLAKLANWVSQSISSQSQALGSGGPSQQLTF